MSSLFSSKQLKIQPVTSTRTKGKNVEGLGTPRYLKGSFQPLNGSDMQALPEGRRGRESFKIYLYEDLNGITSDNNPDLVYVGGVKYEIAPTKASWQNNVLSHYKYIVQKVTTK